MVSETHTARLLRPRFSLLTILFLFALVGCGITIWRLWSEVGPLQAEVRRLRDEVGYLAVDDSTQVHAIRVDTEDPLTWKWRVWIPENRSYVFRNCGERIPEQGFPMDELSSIWVREPGEVVVTYRITRDPRDDKWYGHFNTGTGGVGKDHQAWVEWPSMSTTTGGVGHTTRAYAPDKRVEIVRHRVSQAGSTNGFEDETAGFLIWMEPTP